jgi:quercetin dioxygenase-like cupin family protein
MQRILLGSLSALLATSATVTLAHPHKAGAAKGMKWMDASGAGLPAGAKMAVVSGDPSKDNAFVVRLQMPADYAVPPHHHPTDEKVSIVSGGPLHYGMGDKTDMASAGSLEKGYHVTMQSGMNHWVHAPAATVVQVSGNGPFQIVYVNPADDPRTKK